MVGAQTSRFGSVMRYPLACAYALLRPVTQDDRKSCGRGTTREVLVVLRLAARAGAFRSGEKANFDCRTIPLSVKRKIPTLLLTHLGHVRVTSGEPIAIFAAWRGNPFVSLG